MRVHCITHVSHEGLGTIESELDRRGDHVTSTRVFEKAVFPSLDALDFLVVMGGPMGVNDEEKHPWLAPEKEFIAAALEAGKRVLGICLGAQLIAAASGARVVPNPEKEIGWFPIEAIPAVGGFAFPPVLEVFHWHGDTFELPAGAVPLARSAACQNQAFQLGSRVLGLQFHLEQTPETVRALVEHGRDELVGGRFIQSEEEILALHPGRYRRTHHWMDKVLDHLRAD